MRMMQRREMWMHCSAWLAAAAVPGLVWAANSRTILVVGDSISAEYGLQRGQGWVALLAQRLQQVKSPYQVQNASISGDTTSGGLSRLPALLKEHRPAVVIIELGANDALRGLPLKDARANLTAMVRAAKAAGAKVLLLGMQVPPNFGASYQRDFAAMFAEVAQAEKASLVPFLLKGVAEQPDIENWFQADRIHPQAKGHPLLLDNVWPILKPMLG